MLGISITGMTETLLYHTNDWFTAIGGFLGFPEGILIGWLTLTPKKVHSNISF